jgi:amidohydrolase
MIRGIVEPAGGQYSLEMQSGYPTIYNHPDLVPLWQRAAAKVVGEENVVLHHQIIPGGDDAAFFQQKVPGVYWLLGIRNEEKGFIQPLHSPHFDFNEAAMAIGAAVQVQSVLDYLSAVEPGKT